MWLLAPSETNENLVPHPSHLCGFQRECVSAACDEIIDNDGFRTFLKVVLLLGNEMNKGRGKGVAKGFSMASLMK